MQSFWRDIAVFLDSSPAGLSLCRRAAALAKTHRAHLVGVYGAMPGRHDHPSAGYARGAGVSDLIRRQREADDAEALSAARAFSDLSAEYGVSSEFRVVWRDGVHDGDVLRGIHCDLIVAAHPKPADLPLEWSAERLLLTTGIPVLRVPDSWNDERAIGGDIVIAWNRSREARRAVSDALPFIRTADRVTILTVDAATSVEEPGANLLRHLIRHDAKVDVVAVLSEGQPIADVILAQANERNATLLVIGAYSHPRSAELLFGGVTRSLLATAPLPLLISR
jgi:nucleotide-binding universal stress UspA family protein